MYSALAVGAPAGLAIYNIGGFRAVALVAALAPLLGAVIAFRWADDAVQAKPQRASIVRMFRVIWAPGLGMALASSGVATLGAFLSLRYSSESWPYAGIALTMFGIAYIAVRLLFGGLPDRLGGYKTGLLSLLAQALGLSTIWLASGPGIALAGACITGIGYSLVFPSFGVEAMRRVTSDSRGLAIGAYYACFDLGLALGGPGAGVIVQLYDIPGAFMAAACATLVSISVLCIDWKLSQRHRPAAQQQDREFV
jgi:predicted MFS family arabinose efflux permease